MRLLSKKTSIDFMGKRRLTLVFSVVLITVSISSLVVNGLNFGLDFTGGTLIEVGYTQAPSIADVRSNLASSGLDDAVVQTFGAATDIVVRIPPRGDEESDAEISTLVLNALQQGIEGEIEMRRVEFVGPQVGEDLTEQGILAVVYALIGIFIYVMFRFQWRFSVGAVLALVHDVIICMGVLSLVRIEFDLTVVASMPDEVINHSLNETLARTLMTSLTTLLVLGALFVMGGEIIHGFAFTLIIGVFIGTYSSIFVASPALLYLGVSKYDLLQVEKEGEKLDSMP
jgi:preprotein translocase subunit SecF